MNKEQYGELLKYLGILKACIIKVREKERIHEFGQDIMDCIDKIVLMIPILDDHIN